MIAQILLGTAFLLSSPEDQSDATVAFDFYLNELTEHEMAADAPMARLIEKYLVEATFNTTSEAVFKDRLRRISKAYSQNPDKSERFRRLDSGFTVAFEQVIQKAKKKRIIYSAAGAVVGALVAIPVGRLISTSSKFLLVSIPVGALAGAGAGFLLAQLIEMPDFSYERGLMSRDLQEIDDFLSSSP